MLAGCVALGIAAAACSGDDGGTDTVPTPGITSIAQGTAQSLVTPFPTPLVSGGQIDSSAGKGYTATVPDGWSVRANLIQAADASTDVFFEPLAVGANVQASIAITCIVRQAPSEAEHQAFQATTVARIGVNSNIAEGERQVAGRTAKVVTYHFKSQNEDNTPELDKEDYFFSAGDCDWKLTTSVPAGRMAEYRERFDAFLDSFQVTA
jgi:hypothetical protein